ncbi:MAG: lantibiotic dehydratase [Gemmatimonadota bacterium]
MGSYMESTAGATFLQHFVCRVASLSTHHIERLRGERCEQLMDRLYALDSAVEAERSAVSDLLHSAVRLVEPKKRSAILDLRRDLYNRRSPFATTLATALTLLPAHAADRIVAYCALLVQEGAILEQLSTTYQADRATTYQRFREAWRHEDFRKGLLLSSRSLFQALSQHADNEAQVKFGKLERGLLRYLARCTMKASPFSSFCAILPGEIHNGSPTAPCTANFRIIGPTDRRSLIRLNKEMLGPLLDHLLTRPSVRQALPLGLNPTLTNDEQSLVFLTRLRRQDVFHRLDPAPVLELIRDAVSSQRGITTPRLARLLIKRVGPHASEQSAIAYIDRLIELGFLQFRWGLRDHDTEWDRPLCEFLEGTDDKHARLVAHMLRRLRSLAEEYADGPANHRFMILQQIDSVIANALATLACAWPPRLLPFMEDMTAPARVILSHEAAASDVLRDLSSYIALTRRLAWPRAEQASMRYFVENYYGPHASAVPFLRFYEDFYREHFKDHLQKTKRGNGRYDPSYNVSNPFRLAIVDRIAKARMRISELVHERWAKNPDAEEISVDREDLNVALEGVTEIANEADSIAVFADFIPPRGERTARLVLNKATYSHGYGKWFSRFIYLFPSYVQSGFMPERNTTSKQRIAEIAGDENYNANLHPLILDCVINDPTREAAPCPTPFAICDISVQRDETNPDALCLRHAQSGECILPIDLGFLDISLRPGLFQLLACFQPPSGYRVRVPKTLDDLRAGAPDPASAYRFPQLESLESGAVSYRPRIAFGSLVLYRRSWWVSSRHVPLREPMENDHELFLRINRWRVQHGIPREVYVRVYHVSANADDPHSQQAEMTADTPAPRAMFEKPQYIDFCSPLFVELLDWTTRQHHRSSVLRFEERYPTRTDLAEWNGFRHVSELILQLEFPGKQPCL